MVFIAHLVYYLDKLCSIKGEPADIDPECVSHDEYLTEFKSMLLTQLRNAIDTDITNDPDCTKGRKKTVQVSDFQWTTLTFLYYIDNRPVANK